MIEKKIENLDIEQYLPMEYSKIFLSISNFNNLQNKYVSQIEIEKKKKKKILNPNQTSFYFEDYLETNKKNKYSKSKNFLHDRIYLLFFLFFSLILIFSIKIIYVSLNKVELFQNENPSKI